MQSHPNKSMKDDSSPQKEADSSQIELEKIVLILKSIRQILRQQPNRDISSSVALLVLHLLGNLSESQMTSELQELFLFCLENLSSNTSHVSIVISSTLR